MKALTVLYDATCGFCIACRHWLEVQQPKLLSLDFVASRSPQAAQRFPDLVAMGGDDLVVVSDEGGVYRGARAFIMCLYALEDYREWSLRLASPGLLPVARRFFGLVSRNRRRWWARLLLAQDERVAEVLSGEAAVSCQHQRDRAGSVQRGPCGPARE